MPAGWGHQEPQFRGHSQIAAQTLPGAACSMQGWPGWRVDSLVSSRCAPRRRRSAVIGMWSGPVATEPEVAGSLTPAPAFLSLGRPRPRVLGPPSRRSTGQLSESLPP
jgi:hypothetical protein